ncbi:MAG: NAD(P)-dependent oxidoreductase [Deltaproteobacteria bacterium]|nr:NAD(P)-dependent oxidoreductase [Deltaproteobacteria bacterium]
MEKIGFIGTGGMGGLMALNLLKAGFKVTVFDLRAEAMKGLVEKGGSSASSPKTAAEASEVVLSMLPFGAAVRDVGLGKDGLIEAASGARIWVDLSSVEEQAIIGVDKALRPEGWTVIDASVGGVEEHAAVGELSIRVAGDKKAVDKIRPILEAMGSKITYCGKLGNAKLLKTATAIYSAINAMGIVEIFNWLKSCGISEDISHEVFKDSLFYSESVRRICDRIEDKKFKPRKSWTPKDIGFGLESAQEKGVPLPLTSLVKQLFNVARSNGLDGYEATGIAYKTYELLGRGEPEK